MGKKHVIKKSEEGLPKEGKAVEGELRKEPQTVISSKKIEEGRVYINSSYNNTIITLTDKQGDVLGWVSAGGIGFRGTKKATPFAASKVAENISLIAKKMGIERLSVWVKGIGSGRESAIRSFSARGFDILSIKDETPIPHNGCRPSKKRRV
ncbi:MAG: 30S ribosomal protein S11 [Parcubacteria group bacterium]